MFCPCFAANQVPIMLQQLGISEVCVIKQAGRPREELSQGGAKYCIVLIYSFQILKIHLFSSTPN